MRQPSPAWDPLGGSAEGQGKQHVLTWIPTAWTNCVFIIFSCPNKPLKAYN